MTALSVTIYAGMALLSLDPCLIGLVTLPVSEGVAVWRLWCLCAGGGSGIGLVQGRSVLITIAELLFISICYGYGPYASAGLIAAK
jgi:hypothetical protein